MAYPRLHVISDAIIAASYFSIPVALSIFVAKRRDLDFGWIFWAFAQFITACDFTHVLSIVTLWVPVSEDSRHARPSLRRKNPPAGERQADFPKRYRKCTRYFEALLEPFASVWVFTTWTRRLTASAGLAASFKRVLP